eukprot:712993-Prymnesium_polylepis.1
MGLGSRLMSSLAHLGFANTRVLESPLCAPSTASAPPTHTPPPALLQPAARKRARARAHLLSGVTDARDFGRGS